MDFTPIRFGSVWITAVALSTLLTACNQGESKKAVDTFNVDAIITGLGQKGAPCVFPNARFTAGDQVVLRGAANQILATGKLRAIPRTQDDLCDMRFELKNVAAGEIAYQLTIGATPPTVVPLETLRCPTTLYLLANGAIDKFMGHNEPFRELSCSKEKIPETPNY
ncbi:hypothetical protein PJI18_09735 [Mycobacterium kansasii]